MHNSKNYNIYVHRCKVSYCLKADPGDAFSNTMLPRPTLLPCIGPGLYTREESTQTQGRQNFNHAYKEGFTTKFKFGK
jgi:hypothetical protein